MLASTGPLLDSVCVQGPDALGTGGVDLERDTSRASNSSSSNQCRPRNYCIIRIRITLGSNEMMWRRTVGLWICGLCRLCGWWCRKETMQCSKPNTSPPSDRPRSR